MFVIFKLCDQIGATVLVDFLDRVGESVIDAAALIPPYIRDNSDFEKIGGRMLSIWRTGVDAFASSATRR